MPWQVLSDINDYIEEEIWKESIVIRKVIRDMTIGGVSTNMDEFPKDAQTILKQLIKDNGEKGYVKYDDYQKYADKYNYERSDTTLDRVTNPMQQIFNVLGEFLITKDKQGQYSVANETYDWNKKNDTRPFLSPSDNYNPLDPEGVRFDPRFPVSWLARQLGTAEGEGTPYKFKTGVYDGKLAIDTAGKIDYSRLEKIGKNHYKLKPEFAIQPK